MEIICFAVLAFQILLFGRVILSWFPIDRDGPMGQVDGFLTRATEPVLAPVRRVVPPVRAGGMGLDVSVLLVFFGLIILSAVLGCR